MNFDWRHATGKAGERKVEAFIEEKLNFVYRKVGPPDIGVDGEIEITDTNRDSTGGFLMVQVKATEKSLAGRKSFKVPFDEKHLDYFASLIVVPMIAVVSLADDAIWWKPILHKEHYKGPRSGFGIKIDTTKDQLTKQSAELLRMLGDRSNAMISSYILDEAEGQLDDLDAELSADNWDRVTAESWAQTLVYMDKELRDAECLLRYERRYTDEITNVEARYSLLVERVENWHKFFKEWDAEDLLAAWQAD
jgi:hypothetical protein